MYGKIFEQIFSSSIMKEDLITRYVFMALIIISDDEGFVDMTAAAIAARVGITEDQALKALAELEETDPHSRTETEDGRRIVKIRKTFGWQVVNKSKYRDMISKEERRDYMREYMRNYRKSLSPVNTNVNEKYTKVKCKQPLAVLTHTDTDTDTNTNTDTNINTNIISSSVQKKSSSKLPDSDFIQSLKNNPAYKEIDIDLELNRMDGWLSTRPRRKKTRRFIVNWLNNIDTPLPIEKTKQIPRFMKGVMDAAQTAGIQNLFERNDNPDRLIPKPQSGKRKN